MGKILVDFSGEIIEMENALIAGRLSENIHPKSPPISLYGGGLNLSELHSALFYAHRTAIRLLVEELDVELEEVDTFLLSALTEAVTMEWNARAKGVDDLDVTKVVKRKN